MTNAKDRSRLMTLGAVIAALAGSLGTVPLHALAADGATTPTPQQKAASGGTTGNCCATLSNPSHARGGHKKIESVDAATANAAASSEGPKKKVRIGVQKRDPGERKFDPPPGDSLSPPTAKGSGQ